MTNEQINKAIAEACGWYEEDNESEICWTRDELTYYLHEDELPNHCNDLNAMHEAWLWLLDEEKFVFDHELQRVLLASEDGPYWLTNATARQRAEAFLRTIGKWEEAK